ncbi:hypothetical protein G4H71_20630 [Rhodococcus triatomae]|uniref:Uncharacterized protein n=1 Tax=Rhodococcus triatomae TaxID=300028 RepID=A0A1G8KLE6_9NOCA|nr:hypothetical protein [Rhodococcus triatomae]QNG18961.1 hypothetical protein G4H72_09750 [Rhodococcus triatomae]QNG25125.1 hypothetical protein G4H71_20630 [Rhodococcus triatomae]SDI44228.1 hypothetical protein SAMN05444695_107183 [Rhodococcus triatomae]
MPSLDDLILDAVLDLLQTRSSTDPAFRDRACAQLLRLLQARQQQREPISAARTVTLATGTDLSPLGRDALRRSAARYNDTVTVDLLAALEATLTERDELSSALAVTAAARHPTVQP